MSDYQAWKELGICVRCHHRPAARGRVMCPECAEREAELKRKKYNQNPELNWRRVYAKKKIRAAKNAKNGICVYCGKRKATDGRKGCKWCLIINRGKKARQDDTLPRWERTELGYCYRCGKNMIAPGKKICLECYNKQIEGIVRRLKNEIRDNTNGIRSADLAKSEFDHRGSSRI